MFSLPTGIDGLFYGTDTCRALQENKRGLEFCKFCHNSHHSYFVLQCTLWVQMIIFFLSSHHCIHLSEWLCEKSESCFIQIWRLVPFDQATEMPVSVFQYSPILYCQKQFIAYISLFSISAKGILIYLLESIGKLFEYCAQSLVSKFKMLPLQL